MTDADERGNVKSVLFNHSNLNFHVIMCDRIAEFLPERIESLLIVVVTQMSPTDGGFKGFVSTVMAVIESCGPDVASPSVISNESYSKAPSWSMVRSGQGSTYGQFSSRCARMSETH